jgi:citrate lyase subunit beta/citryl-CoA lyase
MTTPIADQFACARTLLFVPGNRPERFDKAARSSADGVILDLEDAVAPKDKASARAHVAAWLAAGNTAAVRINAVGTPWFDDDVSALGRHASAVMLPKASPDGTAFAVDALGDTVKVVALIETAAGILDAAAICRSRNVIRAAFGSIDLGAEIGVDPDDREALLKARSTVVLASSAAGIAAPLDGVTTDLAGSDPARADAEYALRLGFSGKLCIHPRQAGPVNAAFVPTPEQLTWARRVVAATGHGATTVDGHMIDEPVVRRAHRLIDRHESLSVTALSE